MRSSASAQSNRIEVALAIMATVLSVLGSQPPAKGPTATDSLSLASSFTDSTLTENL
jgi:hypothetical protein